MLQQVASDNAESASDSLDVVFDVDELGGQLLAYANAGQVCAESGLHQLVKSSCVALQLLQP
jgi:hypothetical protein